MSPQTDRDFEALLEYVRDSRGFDFTRYKRPTLLRRVTQRMTELRIESFASYHDYLQVHADEFQMLFDKILINVTEFFRDRPAWDFLAETVIPPLVAKSGAIRIWSSGTASGEEAYSIAILLCEALGAEAFLRRVKIYATDVDEHALNQARSGYTAKDLEAVEPELRNRYFEPQGGRFTFRAALRRALIFGRHDLMQDAPISRLDLLICRNTLMYFTAEAQGRMLARFHYALNDDGFLFLGRAEMLLGHAALFAPVDVKQRLFAKVPRLQLRDRLLLLAQAGNNEAGTQITRQLRLRELAAEAGPHAQLVLDALGTIVLANNSARRLFDLGPGDVGRPLKDLELSYKPVDLRTPIDRATRDRRQVVINSVEHSLVDGSTRHFDVHVAPLLDEDGSVLGVSVSFVDVTQVAQLRAEVERTRHEVETAYEELQSSSEELETTNEELQSTVEELETTNEELQSSNEELETANEELETTNTELQAINNDLRLRTDEVSQLNTFLQAITGNIPMGAIVLDPTFTVKVWNEHAAEMWGLRSDEVAGKGFFDLDIGLPTRDLRAIVRAVMRGNPSQDEAVVKAVTRRGRQIRCRVIVANLDGIPQSAGVVLLTEELKDVK
ncbi:MAG TPA: CheR family methyltransferase [Candidatus Dormibacteraeota bacterium]|nr:CheR family methyltransferase [Candidatus Dormibacteraeota bacterium]